MLKKIEKQRLGLKAFDDYRDAINNEFNSENIFKKVRVTQGLIWTNLDKDLANQYVREEYWIFGIKVRDNIKFIDHCSEEEIKRGGRVGF